MTIKKKPHSSEFKFKVALEALRGDKTSAELCQTYGIVSSQLFKWRKALLERGRDVFAPPQLRPKALRKRLINFMQPLDA